MINALLMAMRTQLDAALNGTGAPAIVEGPAKPPAGNLPRLVLSPGKLELPPPFGDAPPGQMQPREAMDVFPVVTTSAATVRGPYTLGQSPLEGTVSCRFHWNQAGDPLEGKKQRIYPRKESQGDGFDINYATRKVDLYYAAPCPVSLPWRLSTTIRLFIPYANSGKRWYWKPTSIHPARPKNGRPWPRPY